MSDVYPGAGVLICIPTYNEIENIGTIVPAVLAALPGADVLVVDDNSPDGTGRVADDLAAGDARVHVLHRGRKEGLGPAYLDAFSWALARDYRHVFQLDADGSHEPRHLPAFVEALDGVADVVVGSRRVPGGGIEGWGPLRRLVSGCGNAYARAVLGGRVRDLTGGFNGFRREVLLAIDLASIASTGYGFQIELKHRALQRGFRVVERPIVFPDRKFGRSKMSGRIVLEAAVLVWRLRARGATHTPPLTSHEPADLPVTDEAAS